VVDLDRGTGDSADSSRNELRSVLAGNQADAVVDAFSSLHKPKILTSYRGRLLEMSTPAPKKKSRKGLLALVVIVIAAVVLVIPPALAGALMVPVSKVVFKETTGSLSATQATANVSLVTAYEYYFSTRSQGMFRTSDTSVNSNGNTTLKIDLKLTNPSGATVDLGNTNINGGIGTRTHTIYLSVDQGVRVSGSYTLNIDITASVTVGGILEVGITPVVVTTTFTVS